MPAAGSDLITTAPSACPASWSVKPKSATVRVRVVSSFRISVAFAALGAWLTPTTTFRLARLLA